MIKDPFSGISFAVSTSTIKVDEAPCTLFDNESVMPSNNGCDMVYIGASSETRIVSSNVLSSYVSQITPVYNPAIEGFTKKSISTE